MSVTPVESLDLSGVQYPPSIEISETFVDEDAQKLHELALHYGMRLDKLVKYGLGVLIGLQETSEAVGEECHLFIGTGYMDSEMFRIATPQELAQEDDA